MMKRLAAIIWMVILICRMAMAEVFTVTNTYDAGAGSLRQAMINANALPGGDTILFNIQGPGPGPYTIQPASELPLITGKVLIDGYSEPNSYPATSGNQARIMIMIDGGNARTIGFQIGTATQPGNGTGTKIRGVSVINFAYRGLIYYADSCTLEGSFIGVRPDGISSGPNNLGVMIAGADQCTIGGSTPGAGNVISSSRSYGLLVQSSAGNPCTGTMIGNNKIGMDAQGLSALGNGGHGISIQATTALVHTISIFDNIICSNAGSGISMDGGTQALVSQVTIQRNRIGINKLEQSRPNLGNGISISHATLVAIGQTIPDGNIIAFNNENGIIITGNSYGNTLAGNRFFGNQHLAIDLGDNGVTANDPDDADTGPNGYQNFPVIDSAVLSGDTLRVFGKVTATIGQVQYISIFNNPGNLAPETSGHGEGHTPLGSLRIEGTGSAFVPFVFTTTHSAVPQDVITAMATDSLTGNSSEFSAIRQVTAIPGKVCSDTGPTVKLFSVEEVPGATTYTWSVPPSVTLISGQGTPEISTDWNGVIPGNYKVCVTAGNNCGTASQVCFPVMVNSCITLSGQVVHDANGLQGNPPGMINGPGIHFGDSLYVNLVDPASDTVIASTMVLTDGSFRFTAANGLHIHRDYKLILTLAAAASGTLLTQADLPPGWVPVGEVATAGSGSDGTADGILSLHIGNVSPDQIRFGIEQAPVTNVVSSTGITPGGNSTITAPVLSGQDAEDCPSQGSCSTGSDFIITTVPVNGVLWWDADASGPLLPVPLAAGDTIRNYDPSSLVVDPAFIGTGEIVFEYTLMDQGGVAGLVPATATLHLTPLANLTLTGISSPDTIFTGNLLQYTFTLTNQGISDVTGVVMTDLIPAGLTILSATASQGTWSLPFWSVDTLPAMTTVTLTITMTVADSLGGETISSFAVVTSGVSDPNPDDNSVTLVTVIIASNTITLADDHGCSTGPGGGTAVPDILANDLFNNLQATINNLTLTMLGTSNAGVALSGVSVTVAPWVPDGIYTLIYRACDLVQPGICDSAVVTIVRLTAQTFDTVRVCDQPSVTLNGNIPFPGCSGQWSYLSANSPVQITPPDSAIAVASGLTGNLIPYLFRFTLSAEQDGAACEVYSDKVVINDISPSIADAGADQYLCLGEGTTATTLLGGIPPDAGAGRWSQASGPGTAMIQNPLDPASVIENLLTGQYAFIWKIGNGICDSTFDIVDIFVSPEPVGTAGPDAEICGVGGFHLSQALATNYSQITWSTSGSGYFNNIHIQNPFYSPSVADTSAGSVQLTMTVAGGIGCPVMTDAMTLTFAPDLHPIINILSPVTCSSGNGGSLQAVVNGGSPPLSYAWSNGATTGTISGLMTGTYTVTVTDQQGCSGSASETLSSSNALWVIGDVIEPWCYHGTNGAILIIGGSGPPPYTFLWSTGTTTQHLLNVGAGTYTVTVTDQFGCTVTGTWTMGEPDTLIVGGTVTHQGCQPGEQGSISTNVTGGNPPYNYLWSTGATSAGITSLNPGFYYLTVTDDTYCTALMSWEVLPCMNFQVSGFVRYRNQQGTPLNGVQLILRDSSGAQVRSGITANQPGSGQPGFFYFNGLSAGTYQLSGSYNGPWGGGNATDALLIQLRIIGAQSFDALQDTVGNVNASGYPWLSGIDALYVKLRTVGEIGYFPAGDWKISDTAITISEQPVSFSIHALCYGDVNGSFIPGGQKATLIPLMTLHDTIRVAADEYFTYPLFVTNAFETGAVTLFLGYDPADFEISGVSSILEHYLFTDTLGRLAISWSETTPVLLDPKTPIFSVRMKAGKNWHVPKQAFTMMPGCEFSGPTAKPIPDMRLQGPVVACHTGETDLQAIIYPNPFSSVTTLSFTLPENGQVEIRLNSVTGQPLATITSARFTKGTHHIVIDEAAFNLKPGMMFFDLQFTGERIKTSSRGKLILVERR